MSLHSRPNRCQGIEVKRSVFWPVLLFTIVAVIIGVLLPGGPPPEPPRNLPWQIEVLPDGSSRVFGIVLGKTTLGQMEALLQKQAELSLFATDDGKKVVEAYFHNVVLNGLKAKMVATLGFDQQQLQGIFDRGARIATLAQGKRKVTLSDPDLLLARNTPVIAITYLPAIDLDEETVERRFGPPAEKIPEKEGKVVHWLYPDKGLDIAIGKETKEVLQYVSPKEFRRLVEPLRK